jgi:hypothetical protein
MARLNTGFQSLGIVLRVLGFMVEDLRFRD